MTDIAIRETTEEADFHDTQAQATYRVWADRGRKLDAAFDKIESLTIQIASLEARNIELERTNGQLNDRIAESMRREADAIADSSRLKGIMQVSGIALTDGMNRERAPAPVTPFRLRQPATQQ